MYKSGTIDSSNRQGHFHPLLMWDFRGLDYGKCLFSFNSSGGQSNLLESLQSDTEHEGNKQLCICSISLLKTEVIECPMYYIRS